MKLSLDSSAVGVRKITRACGGTLRVKASPGISTEGDR